MSKYSPLYLTRLLKKYIMMANYSLKMYFMYINPSWRFYCFIPGYSLSEMTVNSVFVESCWDFFFILFPSLFKKKQNCAEQPSHKLHSSQNSHSQLRNRSKWCSTFAQPSHFGLLTCATCTLFEWQVHTAWQQQWRETDLREGVLKHWTKHRHL